MGVSSVSNGRTGRFSRAVGRPRRESDAAAPRLGGREWRERIGGTGGLDRIEVLSEAERGLVGLAVEVLQLDHFLVAVLQLLAEVVDVALVLFELHAEVFGLEL